MIAPCAIDLDEAAGDSFADKSESLYERKRLPIRREDVGYDTMERSIFKRVIEKRRERIAHQALSCFADTQPVARMALQTRPRRDASE